MRKDVQPGVDGVRGRREQGRPSISVLGLFLGYELGGAEAVGRQIIRELDRTVGVDRVACLEGGPVRPHPRTDSLGLAFRASPSHRWVKVLLLYCAWPRWEKRLAAQLRRAWVHPPDVVVSFDAISPRVASRAFPGTPRVALVQEPLPRQWPPGTSGALRWMAAPVLRRCNRVLQGALEGCSALLCASDDTGLRLARFVGKRAITCHSQAPEVEPKWPEPDPAGGFLFLGRLSSDKGLDLLLEAYHTAGDLAPLTIVGHPGDCHQHALRHAGPKIRILPAVRASEVVDLYRRHAVVMIPSLYPDPLPGVAIEARAYRRAVIASDQGGLPEILRGYARAGMVPVSGLSRAEVVSALSSQMKRAGELVSSVPDPATEAAFRDGFSPSAQTGAFREAFARAGVPFWD